MALSENDTRVKSSINYKTGEEKKEIQKGGRRETSIVCEDNVL